MNTKVCTNPKCRKELPATTEFFHKSKSGKFGVRSQCKECCNKRNNPVNTDINIKQTCTGICGRELPATTEFFSKNKKGKYGIHSECKECCNKKGKERNNPPNADVSIKQTCTGCGGEFPATLEYFHRDKQTKFGVYTLCIACKNKNNKEYSKTPRGRAVDNNRKAKRRTQKRTQTQFFWTSNKNLIDQIYLVCPKGYDVDHMVPLSKGGDHHESNLCYLPGKVNNSKDNKSIEEFGVDIFNENVIYWQDLLQI
jgi:hypothetical protein